MRRSQFVDIAFLLIVVGMAFALRVLPALQNVFRNDRVIFAGNDPWIHMRNVDVAVAQFPRVLWYDRYRLAPDGAWAEAPLMDLMIAATALIAGRGHPSPHLIDVTGAWFPPIAGALVVIPVFFIARRLFDRAAAWLAATLIAVLPGQLFQRSILGYTDHHVVEALLCACVLLFLMRAFGEGKRRDAVFAGVALGLYLCAWSGGGFLIVILLAAAVAMWLARVENVAGPFAVTFLVAAAVCSPVALHLIGEHLVLPLLVGGAAIVAALERLPRRISIGAVLIVVVALAVMISDDLLSYASRFTPSAGASTIGEIRPLLMMDHHFSFVPLWSELTTSALLAPIGLLLLARKAWRERSAAKATFALWSAAIIIATLAQIRFGYYLAIVAAVLASGAAVTLFSRLHRTFAVVATLAIVVYPNLPIAAALPALPNYGPSPAWIDAMEWMRAHTPEPFERADAYFDASLSRRPAYGVLAWIDNGYWITRIAHRVPVTNPTQARANDAASFFLATDERVATDIARRLEARYVVADRSFPMLVETAGLPFASQLGTMCAWAGVDPSRYFEVYFAKGRPLFVYYPDYYRTMAMRLFAHRGDAWTPRQSTWAIAATPQREITAVRRFNTFEEAEAFVRSDPARWRLVGLDPVRSCVPLPRLTFLTRVREAGGQVTIFEAHPR